ncbi:MAG: BatD family protein [Elusimicrobia bacterium]|nr:BatD family protein [Candidatus Obscuribacterium magneticum]
MTVLLVPFSSAQPSIQMRVEVNPREITIGDPISYQATIIFSSQVAPAPLAPPSPLGEFELLDYKQSPPIQVQKDKISITHSLILTTFSTGTQLIPTLTLNFVTEDGKQVQANTEPVNIVVQSLLDKFGDEGQLRPLKGFFNFRSYLWLWILIGVLIGLGAGFFALKWIQKRKKEALEAAGPPKPPEEIAWDALNQLEFSGLLTDGNIKEFYIRLSQILRQYLENRYKVLALERTTTELLAEFRRLNLALDLTSLLRLTLETGDLVKFAKYAPEDQEIEEDLNRVKQIITVTTPQAAPEQKKEEIPV